MKAASQSGYKLPTHAAVLTTNGDLVGKPGSRDMLDTPCLLIDLSALEANLLAGAKLARESGKALWPHAKAHKCLEIAKRQMDLGAEGLSVASIGEAEVFAANGFEHLLITSTFATDRQIDRVLAVHKSVRGLSVVVDDFNVAAQLIEMLRPMAHPLDVLIDVDMGRERSGCATPEALVSLARLIENSSSLNLAGIQVYAGHLSHMISFDERRAGAVAADARAALFLDALTEATGRSGLRCSGGSTGACRFDVKSVVITDLQWGSYPLMDEEYDAVQFFESGDRTPFSQALRMATRVISSNTDGHATTDAGEKRFMSKYGAAPQVVRGIEGRTSYRPISDEHGRLDYAGPRLKPGAKIEVTIPHCDPTVNLFDALHVVEGDTLVDIWAVAARGRY